MKSVSERYGQGLYIQDCWRREKNTFRRDISSTNYRKKNGHVVGNGSNWNKFRNVLILSLNTVKIMLRDWVVLWPKSWGTYNDVAIKTLAGTSSPWWIQRFAAANCVFRGTGRRWLSDLPWRSKIVSSFQTIFNKIAASTNRRDLCYFPTDNIICFPTNKIKGTR
jgi:hypothetical protein